jgi:hypothetical protein
MKTLSILLAICLIWLAIGSACGSSPGDSGSGGPGPDQHTKKGVQVVSPVLVPDAALDAIDEGIQKAIDRMPAEWTGGRDLAEYRVNFVTPDGCCGSAGNPYLVRGGIQTWGYVSGISSDPTGNSDHMAIVMPHQQDNGWAHPEWVSGTAWSETEHLLERKASIQRNDPEIFWKWQRAGADDTHPHRP